MDECEFMANGEGMTKLFLAWELNWTVEAILKYFCTSRIKSKEDALDPYKEE